MQIRGKIGANQMQNRFKIDYETDRTTKIAVFILVQNHLKPIIFKSSNCYLSILVISFELKHFNTNYLMQDSGFWSQSETQTWKLYNLLLFAYYLHNHNREIHICIINTKLVTLIVVLLLIMYLCKWMSKLHLICPLMHLIRP